LRVIRASASTTTVYIFSGGKVIAEYDNGAAPSSPSREYIYSGSQLLATISGGATTYHHPDHLSVRVSTDSSANVTRTFGHFPGACPERSRRGEAWYETGTASKWKFTSYERDTESNNDYALARFYSNPTARFTSPDPLAGSLVNPQSLNHYAYTLGDPVNLIDPSGLYSCTIDGFWAPCSMIPPLLDAGAVAGVFVTDGFTPFITPPPNPDAGAEGPPSVDCLGMSLSEEACAFLLDGGGGNTSGIAITNPSQTGPQQKTIGDRLGQLKAALANDPDCLAFLSGKGLNPIQTLSDIHDKSVSRGQKLSRRAAEKRGHKILRCFSSRSCLSAVVPLRLRTRHPFAVSNQRVVLNRRLSL